VPHRNFEVSNHRATHWFQVALKAVWKGEASDAIYPTLPDRLDGMNSSMLVCGRPFEPWLRRMEWVHTPDESALSDKFHIQQVSAYWLQA
jgi:hypothetical protein